MSFEEIKEILDKVGTDRYWYGEDEQGDKVVYIGCCMLGDNGYDYDEEPIEEEDWTFEFCPELVDIANNSNPRVEIVECSSCCGCGSW